MGAVQNEAGSDRGHSLPVSCVMMGRLGSCVAIAGTFAFASIAAEAATLEGLQGVVLVDRGGGFSIVDGPAQLQPGDYVIANPGGSAQIVYADGCRIPVKPGDVGATLQQSPCAGGGAQAPGARQESASGAFSYSTLLVGGGVTALGTGAAVLLLSGDDDDNPASP